MVFFSDFGKTVTDLFKKKDYEFNRSVKLKCTTNNTEWTSESTFPITEAGKSTTKSKCMQKSKKFGKITLEVPNTKPMKVEYETPSLMSGFNVKLVSESPKISVEAKYKQGQTAGKCSVSTKTSDSSTLELKAQIAREIKGLWVGGEVKYDVQEGFKGYNAGLHYRTSDAQISLEGNHDKIDMRLHTTYSEKGQIAANFNMNIKENDQLVSVGGKWQMDEGCTIQGFCQSGQSKANAYLLYKHKISNYCTAHIGSTFDLGLASIVDNIDHHYKLVFEA